MERDHPDNVAVAPALPPHAHHVMKRGHVASLPIGWVGGEWRRLGGKREAR
jgi:hypothetical protein